jgi:transcriptional regulator with XRE-family HTH domain
MGSGTGGITLDVLAVRLRELREKHTNPIRSMAVTSELIGLNRNALARYERGEQIPKADTLGMIADYYSVSADYILGRTDEKKKIF